MVRTLAVLFVALGALGVAVVEGAPADASCVGPRVRYDPAEADRGETVTISGEGWGDACNDVQFSGKPLPVLGDPIEKITISLVQGDTRISVARGAADKRYEFDVRIRIPTKLEPGGVNVVATWHRGGRVGDMDFMTDELQITDESPKHAARKVKVVKFGP